VFTGPLPSNDREIHQWSTLFWHDIDYIENNALVGASHMSDNWQMSVAMQRLVDFIFMVTNSTLLRNNTVTLLLVGFSVGQSTRNSPMLCNGWRNYEVTPRKNKTMWLTKVTKFAKAKKGLWNWRHSKRMPQAPSKTTTGPFNPFDKSLLSAFTFSYALEGSESDSLTETR
jgi:hypothetical protein